MNKMELVSEVAEKSGLSKADTTKVLEAVLETIEGALKKEDEVRLIGFGSFATSHRKAGTGRDPRTGKPIEIKASVSVRFKPGKALKDAVNG